MILAINRIIAINLLKLWLFIVLLLMSSVVSAASPRKKLRCGCPPTMNKRIKYHVPTSKESNLKAIRTLELIFLWALSSESIKVRVRHYTCFFIPSTSIALFWLFYCCIQKVNVLKTFTIWGPSLSPERSED